MQENRAALGRFIERPRLTGLLAGLSEKRMALLTAPGGYGKSTLMAAVAAHLPNARFCWVGLDPADASLPIFLQQLARAVQSYLPLTGLTQLAAEMTPTDAASIRYLGRQAAQELAGHTEERLVVVLDDMHHVVRCAPVMSFVDALLQYLPASVHLLVASRTVPPLSLARLHAQGQILQLTTADLAFTAEEVQTFFAERFDIRLSEETVLLLLRRTEGWVTSLVLLGNLWQELPQEEWRAMLRRFPSGGAIFDYLAQEVFDQQPLEYQEFLLTTSVLDKLQPYVLERMLGHKQAGQTIAELEARNLFIVRDGATGVPRYHHLFGAFLREQLAARKGEDTARALHGLAARTYEGLGDLMAAIDQYLLAGEHGPAARLMAEQVDHALKSLHHDVVKTWLSKIPVSLGEVNPDAIFVHAQLAAWRAQHDVVPVLYQRCIELYERQGDTHGLTRTLAWVLNRFWKLRHPYYFEAPMRWAAHPDQTVAVYGRMLLAFARIGRGEWEGAVLDLERILPDIPPATRAYFDCMEALAVLSFWRGDAGRTIRYGVTQTTGRTALGDFAWGLYIWGGYCLQGDAQGLENYQRSFLALEVAPSMERMQRLIGTLGQGMIHLFHRRYTEAIGCFKAIASHFCDAPGAQQVLGSEATFLARSEMARSLMRLGRFEEAARCVEANITLSQAYPELVALAYAQQAELLIVANDLLGARRALGRATAALPPGLDGLSAIAVGVVAARLEAAAGNEAAALERLSHTVEMVRERQCPWWLLHVGGPELWPLLAVLSERELPSGTHGHAIFQLIASLGEQAVPTVAPLLAHPSDQVRKAAQLFMSHIAREEESPQVPVIKAYLLGPMRVYRYDQPVESADWNRTKVKLLMISLLLKQGKQVSRDSLIALLWPEASPMSGRSSLRATVHGLKRALEPDLEAGEDSQYVISQREVLALGGVDRIWCDLWVYEDLLTQARQARRTGRQQDAVQLYRSACDLTQGQFLPEPIFADYFIELRTRVERSYLEACLYVAISGLEQGDYSVALDYGRRALSLDRTCEEGYQVLMRAYLARGERDRAMQVYRTCLKQLRQLIGQAPSPETAALLEG